MEQNPAQPKMPVAPVNQAPPQPEIPVQMPVDPQPLAQTPPVQPFVTTSSGVTPPPPPVEKKSSKMKWLIIIILLVLLAVSLALGGYYFLGKGGILTPSTPVKTTIVTPTPTLVPVSSESGTLIATNTANWKTYIGMGFSIKYPADYATKTASFVPSPKYLSGNSVVFQNLKSSIILTESTNSQNLTTATALGNGPGLSYTKNLLTGKTIRNFVVDGTAGVGVENIPAGQSDTGFDVIWINNGKIYQAITTTQEGYNTLRMMLSTFKFTQ